MPSLTPWRFSYLFSSRKVMVAQRLKHLPGMRETRVRSLGWEDPLEKEMATHSSTLPWRIPWKEEPGRLQSMGSQRVWHDWATSLRKVIVCALMFISVGFPGSSKSAKQKSQVQSLGGEDPLEEGMAAHSSILALEIPWTQEPGGLQFIGSQRVGHDWATKHVGTKI